MKRTKDIRNLILLRLHVPVMALPAAAVAIALSGSAKAQGTNRSPDEEVVAAIQMMALRMASRAIHSINRLVPLAPAGESNHV